MAGVILQGLLYALMAFGVYITYRVLNFPDLTVDGSFPLGAAITARVITGGGSPGLALLLAVVGGGLAGLCTGLIHVKGKLRDLLSGIITMTALYAINLHIAGRSNVHLFAQQNLFHNTTLDSLFKSEYAEVGMIVVALAFVVVVKLLLDLFFKTRAGLLLRAVGDNDGVVTMLAKNSGRVKILGLCLSNALVALCGAIVCQQQQFFEITMGTGTIVMGLAIVIMGTKLCAGIRFVKPTTAVVIGSLLYKGCVAGALALGLAANDLRLIMAGMFLVILLLANRGKGEEDVAIH